MRFVCRQGLLKVMVISLVIVFGLGVLSSRTEAITLGELVDPTEPKPTIVVDKLIFSDFDSPSNFGIPDGADLDQIKVEPIGAGTAHPGLRFIPMDPESAGSVPPPWSLNIPEGVGFQRTQISYKVAHLDEVPLIKESSIILYTGQYTGGSSAWVTVTDEILDESMEVSHIFRPVTGDSFELEQTLSDKVELSPTQTGFSALVTVLMEAKPKNIFNHGRVSVGALEQRFTLAPSMAADAAPVQVVFDEVTLDGGTSIDGVYEWELKHRDNPDFDKKESGVNPLVTGLEPGLYDVTLKVTVPVIEDGVEVDKVKHIANMLLAAAGACEANDSNKGKQLHLWRFKIKKYKYCNWAFARVYGTLDASDLPLDSSEDELTAKVILQVLDGEGKTVGEWSGEIPAEIKDRRYKYVIRNKWW